MNHTRLTNWSARLSSQPVFSIVLRNTPAKPMFAPADTLKSRGFFMSEIFGVADMKRFEKPAIDVAQQLLLLKERGLSIQDQSRASWRQRLYDLLTEFDDIPKHAMGLPTHWQDDVFWQTD